MVGPTRRVVIADDERPARRFLANLLPSLPDVEIVGEATDGVEALQVIAMTQPDVALLDVQMPGLKGCCVARSLPPEHAPFVCSPRPTRGNTARPSRRRICLSRLM
jgi:CheY-like chemotaxis protein